MSFKDLTKKTKKISAGFPEKFQWTARERFVDLVEEVGELANAILIHEKKKPKSGLHYGNSIADALCDILFDILLLADLYNIDLDTEYPAMLERLTKRIKKASLKNEGGFTN